MAEYEKPGIKWHNDHGFDAKLWEKYHTPCVECVRNNDRDLFWRIQSKILSKVKDPDGSIEYKTRFLYSTSYGHYHLADMMMAADGRIWAAFSQFESIKDYSERYGECFAALRKIYGSNATITDDDAIWLDGDTIDVALHLYTLEKQRCNRENLDHSKVVNKRIEATKEQYKTKINRIVMPSIVEARRQDKAFNKFVSEVMKGR